MLSAGIDFQGGYRGVRAGKTARYKGAINEGEVDMLYTPNGCIYNDGGIMVRCHDFTPRHLNGFWHLQQYFRQYTDVVKHRKAMRIRTEAT